MLTGSQVSPEQIRAHITAAHTAKFGSRTDDALTSLIETTSNAIAMVAGQSVGAYGAEPDFITGSSEKESVV